MTVCGVLERGRERGERKGEREARGRERIEREVTERRKRGERERVEKKYKAFSLIYVLINNFCEILSSFKDIVF